MNPDVAWSSGAQPFAVLDQAHDRDLLESELLQGNVAS